ncbi:MAG: hypothetical protein JO108_00930 [Acidobacteriaceae bacterium]|nr:hypothetical protein [Acidobacteriaceae bacterium]
MRFFPSILSRLRAEIGGSLTVMRLNETTPTNAVDIETPADFKLVLSRAASELDKAETRSQPSLRRETAQRPAQFSRIPTSSGKTQFASQRMVGNRPSPDSERDSDPLKAYLNQLAASDPEIARRLVASFVESSPATFDRLIAAIEHSDWQAGEEAARELRAGPARVLLPGLDRHLQNLETGCASRSLGAMSQSIEPAFGLYRRAFVTMREWLTAQRCRLNS